MYCSICLYFDIICRYSGVEASSQLMTCSAPCELTKANSHRLCSSSKRGGFTSFSPRSLAIAFSAFSSSAIFSGGFLAVAFEVDALHKIGPGSSSVTFSSRMRLSTLSKKPM